MEQNSGRLWRKVRYVQVFYSLVTKNSFREQEPEIEAEDVQQEMEVRSSRKVILNVYHICTSHLGLVVLLLLYTFAGAWIFNAIEGREHPVSDKIILDRERNVTLEEIVRDIGQVDSLTLSQVENITWILTQRLVEFEQRLSTRGLLCQEKKGSEIWSYWAAVGFCMSVYTTIGYGNMAPETTAGRWVCIVYSIIGIPLCLITLADLGLSFSKGLKYCYRKARLKYIKCRKGTFHIGCCVKRCCTKVRKDDNEKCSPEGKDTDFLGHQVHKESSAANHKANKLCKPPPFSHVTEESDISSTSLLEDHQKAPGTDLEDECNNISNPCSDDSKGTTYDTTVSQTESSRKKSSESQVGGRNTFSKQLCVSSSYNHRNQNHHLNEKDKAAARSVVTKFKLGMQSNSPASIQPHMHHMLVNEKAMRLMQHGLVGTEDKGNYARGSDEHSHVPMILPIFITMMYILLGVLIYSQWEGWDFTEAFYFTFISLSTIGFGDFVSTRKYVMVSIMYQLLGLALVAMTVTFLMELANATLGKAKYKVDRLAEKKFGFAVVENDVRAEKRVPMGVPLKNRKLKTQLSEFI